MRVTLLSVAVAMLSLATGANAHQSTSGQITGRVLNSLREPMPGVVVLARRTGEGITARTETNRDGRYGFASLPSGDYSLDFDLLGFDVERRNDVPTRTSANAADIDVQLAVSTICECIVDPPLSGTLVDVPGRIVDVSGRALAHAKLMLRADARHVVSGYSGVAGQFIARLSVGSTAKLTVSYDGFETTTRDLAVRAKNFEAVITLFAIPAARSPRAERLERGCRCASLFRHSGW